MLIAPEVPDSLSDFIQLLIQTFSLLAGSNVSFELFHYLGKTAFIGTAQTQSHSLQPNRPHCHFLLSLSVYLTERAEAEELKLDINHKNTPSDWDSTRASLSYSFLRKLKQNNKTEVWKCMSIE